MNLAGVLVLPFKLEKLRPEDSNRAFPGSPRARGSTGRNPELRGLHLSFLSPCSTASRLHDRQMPSLAMWSPSFFAGEIKKTNKTKWPHEQVSCTPGRIYFFPCTFDSFLFLPGGAAPGLRTKGADCLAPPTGLLWRRLINGAETQGSAGRARAGCVPL